MFFLFIIVVVIIIIAKQNKNGGQSVSSIANTQKNYQNQVNYGQRINLYENAIGQNRYHSITKLAHDYRLPAHVVLNDIKMLQKDGYFTYIEVDYNHDEIIYLEEVDNQQNNMETQQRNASARKEYEKQGAGSVYQNAYSSTRTVTTPQDTSYSSSQGNIPVPEAKKAAKIYAEQSITAPARAKKKAQNSNSNSPVRSTTTKKQIAHKKIDVELSQDIVIGGAQEEYQPDYSMVKPEYDYIAEYLDTSHIWDDLNPELFPEDNDMMTCPKCGTKNIIVRSSDGKCNCYFCQEELI